MASLRQFQMVRLDLFVGSELSAGNPPEGLPFPQGAIGIVAEQRLGIHCGLAQGNYHVASHLRFPLMQGVLTPNSYFLLPNS